MWWPGTELNRRRQPFQATLCCSLNNLSDFRWPPKYLRSRERQENRGWRSWVQEQARKACKLDRNSAVHLRIACNWRSPALEWDAWANAVWEALTCRAAPDFFEVRIRNGYPPILHLRV